jgi:hypothetical protein
MLMPLGPTAGEGLSVVAAAPEKSGDPSWCPRWATSASKIRWQWYKPRHLAIERYSNFAGAHIDLAAGG